MPVKCHCRAALSSADLSGAKSFRRRFCFARSSILAVLRLGFMAQGMSGSAVGSAGFAVGFFFIPHRPGALLHHRVDQRHACPVRPRWRKKQFQTHESGLDCYR